MTAPITDHAFVYPIEVYPGEPLGPVTITLDAETLAELCGDCGRPLREHARLLPMLNMHAQEGAEPL